MELGGTVSASVLAELLRPALVVGAALLSTLVLAHALRVNSPLYIVAGWTLIAFLLPHIVFPLYLAVRLLTGAKRRREAPPARRRFARWALPALLYLIVLLAATAVFYWRDYHTFDAHLERGAAARLRGRHSEAAQEYQQALQLRFDAHTQKLVALELLSDRRYAEALTHFRFAEEAGAADESTSFHIARALDELRRAPEAQARYEAFLRSNLCTQVLPDARCQLAGERLAAIAIARR